MASAANQSGMKPGTQICTLKYRQPSESILSEEGEVVLLVVKSGHKATLYAHRDLKLLIAGRDQQYVEEFIQYVIPRAQELPDELFEYLSGFAAGPIFAHEVTSFDEAWIAARYPEFSPEPKRP